MKASDFRDKQIYGNTYEPYFVRFGNLADVKDTEIVYIPTNNMSKLIDKNIRELGYTKGEIINHIKKKTDFTEEDIAQYNMVAKLLFYAEGEFIEDIHLSESKYKNENTPIFRGIFELSDDELWELRQEICLNSLYYADYYNKFKLCTHKLCDLFDWYLEFLCNTENWDNFKLNDNCEISKDIDTNEEFLKVIKCYDNKENLAQFRKYEYTEY